MADLGTVYVEVKADYDGFQKKSKGAFLGIGKAAAAAFVGAFAAVKVVDFFGDSIDAASDLEESINAVSVVFGDAAEEVLAIGENAATSFGLSKSEFNAFAVQFSNFAKTVVGEGGDVAGTVDDITTRVADFASVMNLDVAEAAQVFQSGLAGQTEPLRRYGIDLSAAAVQAHALATGIWDGSGAMSENEKVLARYSLLMEQTEQVAGDFANTSDSLANRQRIAGAAYEDAKAKLGEALLPVMQAVMQFVTDKFIPAIEALAPVVQDTVDWVVQAWEWLREKLQPVFDWIVNTINWVRDWWQRDSDTIAATTEGLWSKIAPVLERIGEIFMKTFEAIQLIVERFVTVVSWVWDNFGDHIMRQVRIVWDYIMDIISGATKIIEGIIDTFIGIITLDWDRAWEGIKSVLSGAVEAITGIITGMKDTIVNIFGALWGFIWDKIKNVPGDIAAWGWDIVRSALAAIGTLPGALAQFASDAARAFIDKLKGFVETVKNTVKSVFVDAPLAIIGKGWLWGSPSRLMQQLGQDITTGLVQGIGRGSRDVEAAIAGLTPSELGGASLFEPGISEIGGPGKPLVVNNFHAPVGGSMTDFARQIAEEAAMELRLAYG